MVFSSNDTRILKLVLCGSDLEGGEGAAPPKYCTADYLTALQYYMGGEARGGRGTLC